MIQQFISLVQSGADLAQIAVRIQDAIRISPAVQQVYSQIDFSMDDDSGLPSSNPFQEVRSASQPSSRGSSVRSVTDQGISGHTSSIRRKRQRTGSINDMVNPPISVPAKPWTSVTDDDEFVSHLISLWFTWAHPWWHWVDETLFLPAMRAGNTANPNCSRYLVNMILADSCVCSRTRMDQN